MQRSDKEISDDPNFDRKLNLITAGANPWLKKHLLTRISRENCQVIIDYILAMQVETNTSQGYRVDTIGALKELSEFHNDKPFSKMTRNDILTFLDKLAKSESDDPTHKWYSSYNTKRAYLLRFFKWLHCKDRRDVIPPDQRPTPDCMLNIPRKHRRKNEQWSKYQATDLWTEEDDALFYKHCPSPRDRCYHAVGRDTGSRPEEILKIKIKDIVFRQTDEGYEIALLHVSGKTGVQKKRLYYSIPRLKDWLTNGHPYPGNTNSPLFCGIGRRNTGRAIKRGTMYSTYKYYKTVHFPQKLKDPTVTEEDKHKIRDLLRKPWNPYVRRHTSATNMYRATKDPKTMNEYFGWTEGSKMWERYSHYFNDESIDVVLTLMDGLKPLSSNNNVTNTDNKKSLLKPKVCINCSEMNKPENKHCSKCRFPLTPEAYNEKMNESEKTEQQLESMQHQFEELQKKQNEMQEEIVRGMAYQINYGMQGISFEQVMEQLASQFEKAIKESEERERTGEELKIKEGFAPVDFNTETLKEFIATVKEGRHNSNLNKKDKG
jgi:integrase/recombinase XerD